MSSTSSGTPASASAPGREWRSRKNRPCDRCRKQKQACIIQLAGHGCEGCSMRRIDCTFDLQATQRSRRTSAASISTSTVPPGLMRQIGVASSSKDIEKLSSKGSSLTPPPDTVQPIFHGDRRSFQPASPPTASSSLTVPPQVNSAHHLASTGLMISNPEPRNTKDIPVVSDAIRCDTASGEICPLRSRHSHEETSRQNRRDREKEEQENVEATFIGPLAAALQPPLDVHQAPRTGGSNEGASPNSLDFVLVPNLRYGSFNISPHALYSQMISLFGPGGMTDLINAYEQFTAPAICVTDPHEYHVDPALPVTSIPLPIITLRMTILAHSIIYLPQYRSLHMEVWNAVLLALIEECLHPKTTTLKCLLLALASRPAANHAQTSRILSVAISTAHQWGLHVGIGPSGSNKREQSQRRRMMWTLIIHDKFRTLLFDRPAMINLDDIALAIPSLDDLYENASTLHIDSLRVFIALCSLAVLVNEILVQFYTLRAKAACLSDRSAKISDLDDLSARLRSFEADLPSRLGQREEIKWSTSETGVASFQVALFGVKFALESVRIRLHSMNGSYDPAGCLELCQDFVLFLERLVVDNREQFWLPVTPFFICHAGRLISLAKARVPDDQPDLYRKFQDASNRYHTRLKAMAAADLPWTVAEQALDLLSCPHVATRREVIMGRNKELYDYDGTDRAFSVSNQIQLDHLVDLSSVGFSYEEWMQFMGDT